MSKQLKISIITVVFNGERYIEQTIQSVLRQDYQGLEYVVIDGDSKDGTKEILSRYSSRIDTIVSEPDTGIANAMNKGLELATGDFVYFLNSDDQLLHSNSVSNVMGMISLEDEIVAGSIRFGSETDNSLIESRGFSFWTNFKGLAHQACVVRRDLMLSLGGFDEEFKICMDYDFFLKAYRRGARCRKLDFTLALMRDEGISSARDWANVKQRLREERAVHDKNLSGFTLRAFYAIWWKIYPAFKYIQSHV